MGKINKQNLTGKIVYGFAFCILLPILLIYWARHAPAFLPPVPPWTLFAWILMLCGALMLGLSMLTLWTEGKGLPMNAFPPKYFVSVGTYGLFRHPIYLGASWMVFGTAMVSENSFAFWIIAPCFALACIALVWGFERQHIRDTFGMKEHNPFFALPAKHDMDLTWKQRIALLVMIYAPWIVFYELALIWSESGKSFDTRLPFESLPVVEEAEWIYISIYGMLFLIPFVIRDRNLLIDFTKTAWWATGIGMLLLFTLPLYCSQIPFQSKGLAGELLSMERSKDSVFGAFPSFHVIWSLWAGSLLAKQFSGVKWLGYGYAVAVCIACYLTAMHAILDILAGALVFGLAIYRDSIFKVLLDWSQRLANSWSEKHIGPLRIINHAFYSGLCAFIGLLIGYFFIDNAWYLVAITVFSLVCAALWGQFIEGSPALLRPFGYYGCILGAIIGCTATSLTMHISGMNLLAIFALAAPFVQGVGRLRCLIQGCCHGRLTSPEKGIIVLNPRSRVCHISHLKGRPIHNTQLYSIATNLVTACVLWKLWFMDSPAAVLVGVYLICNGLGRFVEESFRGEIQTKVIGGLRIYQWASVVSMCVGAILTTWESAPLPIVNRWLDYHAWIPALCGGLLTAFLLSMDFPASKRRFSRLSG